MASALDRLLGDMGAPSTDALTVIFDQWAQIVGPTVAQHASPAALRDGTLVIVVQDPAWATQLKFLEAEIVAEVSSRLPRGGPERVEVQIRRERT